MKKVKKSKCRHCGQPIRYRRGYGWVHDDPDENPKSFDYGWISCSGGETSAEPK